MSKRDKRKARQEEQKRQEAAATSKPKPAATELISKIEAELPAIQVSVSELYENAASASDTTGTTPDPSPAETEVPASDTSTPSPESLKSLSVELKAAMSAVKEAERRFDAARKGAEELRKRNEERANALAEDRGKLNAERDELKREKGSLASNRDALIQREQQLNECLMDLDLREERAKAGFIDQWDALREEHSQRLKKDELAHSARLDQERKELDQTRADVANRQRELDLVRERLEGKEQDLGRQERRLQVRDSMLDEDRKELAAQAQADARAEVESLETQLRGEEATIKALRGQCDRLHEWKAAKEAAEVERGGKSPDQLVEELKTANNRIQELHAKLRESLPQDQAEELKVLRRQLEDSQKMTATLRGELAEANGQRDRLLVQVGETESHTVVFTSLQKQNALLNNEHKRLQDEIRALMDARQSDATFEACEQMDQDADYSALPPRFHRPTSDRSPIRPKAVLLGRGREVLHRRPRHEPPNDPPGRERHRENEPGEGLHQGGRRRDGDHRSAGRLA
jgi:hypothetical protein